MAKYFTDEEFACQHCGQLPEGGMDARLLEVLDTIRERVGKPVNILSGYRCEVHNAEVGGVPGSTHTLGLASDICAEGVDVETLAQIAEECGADGVGRYFDQGFVHCDTRGQGGGFRWSQG